MHPAVLLLYFCTPRQWHQVIFHPQYIIRTEQRLKLPSSLTLQTSASVSIFLSRSKAWYNRTTGACTCRQHNIYCICSPDTRRAKGIGGRATSWGNKNCDILHKLCKFVFVGWIPSLRTVVVRWTVIKQYLTALHGVRQALQFPVGYRHVVLAHGSILEAPTLAVVIDELSCFAGEEQGFLIVLLAEVIDE